MQALDLAHQRLPRWQRHILWRRLQRAIRVTLYLHPLVGKFLQLIAQDVRSLLQTVDPLLNFVDARQRIALCDMRLTVVASVHVARNRSTRNAPLGLLA